MGSYATTRAKEYSYVDQRLTPMSDEDKKWLNGWGNQYGYFQTSESWRINKAIRDSAQFGIPLQEAIGNYHPGWDLDSDETRNAKIDKVMKTIRTMDKNMKPLDDDIKVVRMTTGKWLLSMLKSFGLATPDLDTVTPDMLHYIVRKRMDKINDFLQNNDATYYDQTFQSATYNLSLSDSAFSNRPVRIEYVGTKGTKAMFSPTGEESEIVFDRKSGLDIQRLGWDDDKNQLVIYGKTRKK